MSTLNSTLKRTFLASLLAVVAIVGTACSSGGSTTGSGVNVTGLWEGTLRSRSGRQTRITMNIVQNESAVTGLATIGTGLGSCVTGGEISSGTLINGQLNVTIGSLRISADATRGGLSGIWNLSGTAGSDTVSGCNADSGTFVAQ